MNARRLALAALLAGALTPANAAVAAPPDTPATDGPCRLVSLNASPADDTLWVAVLSGSVTAPGAAAVSVRCAVHVGDVTHSAQAAASETSAVTPHGAVLEPRAVTYAAGALDDVALCGVATVDGTRWYWTEDGWSSSAASRCRPLLPVLPDTTCPTSGCPGPTPDPLVCPVLADVAAETNGVPGVVEVQPEGDIDVAGEPFWDCPPYEPVDRQK